jgi:hypothetical protein
VQRFRDAGFTGTLTREDASFEAADVTKPAAAVLETRPGRGAEVYVDESVVIRTNPDDPDMPRLIPELATAPGEQAVAYAERRAQLGLGNVQLETAGTTDLDYSTDTAVSVTPVPGSRVRTTTALVVYRNPPVLYSESSGGCHGPAGPDPGARPDPLEEIQTFSGYNPMTGASADIKLRWGNENWGYQHISASHGWDALEDPGLTQIALGDPAAVPVLSHPGSYDFYYFYLKGALECTRRVTVQFQPRPGTQEVSRGPKYITNSFSYEGWSKRSF